MKEITEELRSLVEENFTLASELRKTQEKLEEETRLRKSAEEKYFNLCERCMCFYVTNKDIMNDTLLVSVSVPRFMSQDEFTDGLTRRIISACNIEREEAIFQALNTSRRKNAT